jgi:hypothetical protein
MRFLLLKISARRSPGSDYTKVSALQPVVDPVDVRAPATAVGRYDRRPFIASRIDRCARIPGCAVNARACVEGCKVDVVLAEAAFAIGEEVDAGAVGRKRGIEVVRGGVEGDDARLAPAAVRAFALDVPPAARCPWGAAPADRAPQHALTIRAECDANFGLRRRDDIRRPQLRGTDEEQGTSKRRGLHGPQDTFSDRPRYATAVRAFAHPRPIVSLRR